ncbi:MAG: protein phosphatase 2C domain-containing protein [Ferruginibacter sp.]
MGEYFFGITDKGKCREKNEDTFIVFEVPGNGLLIACVIDGVGGYSGGDIAASIARDIILEHLQKLTGEPIQILQDAIIAANTKIIEEKKKDNNNEQMACVLTCAITDIKNNKIYYAHVGDTRLYLLRDLSLVKLSRDHSVVGFLEESGRLSEEDAMLHPRRNEITRALGFDEIINNENDFIETGESPFLPGDTILICSDGLTDMIDSSTILSILLNNRKLAERADELVRAANEAGGNDNITAVIVQNNNKPLPKIALKPAERKRNEEKSQLRVIKDINEKQSGIPVKRSRSIMTFLALFLLCFLAIILFQKSTNLREKSSISKIKMTDKKKERLQLFINGVNDSSRKYSFIQGDSLAKLSSPIMINKDSFYISGNGITITCDSNYKSAAIIINSTAKHIVLDSLVFKGFDIAIIAQKNNIVFKNVRFINCRVTIVYELSLPDTTITGRLIDSIFIPVSNPKQL